MGGDIKRRWIDGGWLLFWALFSGIWCVTAAGRLGATFDEPFYLTSGLEFWRTGSHHALMKKGTMPLPMDLQTLPLRVTELATGRQIDLDRDWETALFVTRSATLGFWAVLLVYAWLVGRAIGGRLAGLLAVALLAAEPTLLAHASLSTTDIALTAAVLAFAFHFRLGRERGWWLRVAVPGLCFGIALLAKASALAFLPLCILATEIERRRGDWRETGGWLRFVRDAVQIGVLGLTVCFLYCGTDGEPEPSFLKWAHKLPEGLFGQTMVWLAENLRVFPNGGEALVRQIKHNFQGHDGAFLLGQARQDGFWYYFPVALSMKLSVPLLLLVAAMVCFRTRSLLTWAGAAAGILLLFSLNCRVQIGIRLVLPLVVFGTIALAAAVVRAGAELPVTRQRFLGALVAIGLCWSVGSAVRVWPQGLCFVNELWGGTEQGYLCLSDSNYDWGQGLKELSEWQDEHGRRPMDVWYFGTDPELSRLPLREVRLHQLPVSGAEDVRHWVRGECLAVSTTLMHGMVADSPSHRAARDFLRGCPQVGRTTTFLIYDLGHADGRASR